MQIADLSDVHLHYRWDGDPAGRVLVFANSLGTDLRLWDPVMPLLPPNLRILRYDMRGHGLSACPPAPYSMDDLTNDAEKLLDHLDIPDCTFIGLSVGGMVGQALARRSTRIKALVLSNSAALMGTPRMWRDRMQAIREGGLEAIADAVLDRWFAPTFRRSAEAMLWRNMLVRVPTDGYLGCCAAIGDADLTKETAGLTLPTLVIAGADDGASPPELVQATAGLIPGASFEVIENAGHLPCVEQPGIYARLLIDFLEETGHV